MRKLVVVYHSVSGAEPAVVGSRPVTMGEMISHIVAAKRKGWDFGSVENIREPVKRNTLYITSDDGTIDWARNAIPWLLENSIPSHTAIITGPWFGDYPITHRIQIILDAFPDMIRTPEMSALDCSRADSVYWYEKDESRRRFKYLLNFALHPRDAHAWLGEPTQEEADLLKERFAFPSDYPHSPLVSIGNHTVNHSPFNGDVVRYCHAEIWPCSEHLNRHKFKPSPVFTLPLCPVPRNTASDLVDFLRRDFTAMFDGNGEWDGISYIIPRIDAKHILEHL